MTQGATFAATGMQALNDLFDKAGVSRRYDPGTTIACEGELQQWAYRVSRGCVRSCLYSQDGYRKILRFRGRGDILGPGISDEWRTTEEAVDTVVIDAVPVAAFEAALAGSEDAQRDLRTRLAEEIEAHARLLVLTANSSAVDRVRVFLREFAQSRKAGGFVSLPMCRRDIADHLGLSMESVCRSISTLKRSGEIELKGASFFRFPEQLPEWQEANQAA